MKKEFFVAIGFFFSTLGTGWAFDLSSGMGPLPVRNFQPVALLFLGMEAESPRVLPPGRAALHFKIDESNTILDESYGETFGTVKMETLRGLVGIRYGVLPRVEAGLDLSTFYRSPGYLDGFIKRVEKAFSRLNPDRIFRKNSFDYEIQVRGETLIRGENHTVGFSDLVIHAKGLLLNEENGRPMVSVRLALKLPTGNRAEAFGSGRPEPGLGIAAEKHFHSKLVAYLNANVVFSQGRLYAPGLSLQPVYSAMLGAEWRVRRHLSLHLQGEFYTSPIRGSGLNMLDNGLSEFAIGVSYAPRPDLLMRLYAVENINTPVGSGADFTYGVALSWNL
jgi:hypothetical protein